MKRVIVFVVVIVVIAAAVAGGWWYVNENPDVWFMIQDEAEKAVVDLGLEPEEEPLGLVASGFIEAEEASVTTEVGGRIVELYASEGDDVNAGQVVAELDDSLLVAQIEMAEADLAVAEANLALVKAGVPEETLDYARAMVHQAEVARDVTLVAWQDAQIMLENPQDLELAIVAARSQLAVLDYQILQAEALANAAQVGRDMADDMVRQLEEFEPITVQIPIAPGVVYEKEVGLPNTALPGARKEQATAMYQSWEAWTGVEQAKIARAGAERYLALLVKQKANPVSLQARVDAAESEYQVATAAVELAEAQVEGLMIGATPEQISAVEAQIDIAQTALDALEVQEDKLVLQAPISGLVLERPVHVGEVAVPGAPLMTLADLDSVTLTIYVPENQLGKVQIGQAVSVTVDAYPDRVFQGSVIFISNEAEFTPKNVQTREERVNMVFAVKVRLPNDEHELKPGMPADAVIPDELVAR